MLDMNGFNSIFGMLCDFSDEGASAVLNFFKERVQNAKFQKDINDALKNYNGGEKALETDLKNFISISLAPEKEEKIKKKIGKLESKGKSMKPSVSDYLDFFSVRTADEITDAFIDFKTKDNMFFDDNSKKAFYDIILLSRRALVESYQAMISNESKAIIVTLTDMFEKFANANAITSFYQTFYDVPDVCPKCTSDDFYFNKKIFICKHCGKKINLNSFYTKKITLEELQQSLSQSIENMRKDTLDAIEKSQNAIINTLSEELLESEETIVGAIYETEGATLEAIEKSQNTIINTLSEELLESEETIVGAIYETEGTTLEAIDKSKNEIVDTLSNKIEDLDDKIDNLDDKIDALSDKIDSRVSSKVDSKIDKSETRTIEAIEKSNEQILEAIHTAAVIDTANAELSTQRIIDSNEASEEKTRKVIHDENELTRESIAEVAQQLSELQKAMDYIKENSANANNLNNVNSDKKRKPRKDSATSNVATTTVENENILDNFDECEDFEEFEEFEEFDGIEEECKETVEGVYTRKGIKVIFGTYPQTRVTNDNLIAILNKNAGALPFNNQSQTWTSYGYYVKGNVTDFMWYRDIIYKDKKYRGVYFTAQRPNTTQSYAFGNYSFQDESGYDVGKVYWFKFEPLSWTVINEDIASKTALILCDNIIDSREYYINMTSRRIGGDLVYPCNYAYSTIRNWLNDSFYNTAFTPLQQAAVQITTIENGPATMSSSFNSSFTKKTKKDEQTIDKVFVLSYSEVNNGNSGASFSSLQSNCLYQKKTTDYAQSQGVYTQQGNGEWWLRSATFGSNSNFVCIIDANGRCIISGCSVDRTDKGIVPALYIKF